MTIPPVIRAALASATDALTREEELAAFARWREHNDTRARERLARSQLRYVASRAMFHARRSLVPADELFAEGCEGLAIAMQKFEPERNARLNTYAAIWINRWIVNAVAVSITPFAAVRSARASLSFAIRANAERIFRSTPAELDDLLVSRSFRNATISPGRARELAASMLIGQPSSLDASRAFGSEDTMHSAIADRNPGPEQSAADREEQRRTEQLADRAMACLTERERFVVRSTIACDDDDRSTLEAVGQMLDLSRERIRQIQVIALEKMRRAVGASAPPPKLPKASGTRRPRRQKITHQGVTLSVRDWARRLGIPASTIYERLDRGLPTEVVLQPRSEPGPLPKKTRQLHLAKQFRVA